MITQLTPEQESLIYSHREEWKDLFWKTNNPNKDNITKSIEWLYEFSGLKKPFVWFCDSPLMCQLMANILNANGLDNVLANVWNNVWNNVSDNVSANVRANVRANVSDNVWDNVRDNVSDNVSDNVWDNVLANVSDNVRANVRDNVSDNVRANVWDNDFKYYETGYYGDISDYGWLSFYDYFYKNNIINIPNNIKENFKNYINLAKSGVFSMIQLDGLCIVSINNCLKKYIEIRGEKRLHSEDSPALAWQDGYKIYALYGVIFDYKLWSKVTNGDITFREVMAIENIEQRYAALRLLNPDKIIQEANAVLVDTGKKQSGYNGDVNKLYKLTIDDVDTTFLRYSCPSTGRVYMKFVPNDHTKADEAQAWSFQLGIKEYELLSIEK